MEAPTNIPKNQLRKGFLFAVIENLLKPIEPILVLLCAALFVGGPWGYFKYYEAWVYILFAISIFALDRGVIWIYKSLDEQSFIKEFSQGINFSLLLSIIMGALALLFELGWIPGRETISGGLGDFAIQPQLLLLYLINVPLMVIWHLFTQALINRNIFRTGVLIRTVFLPFGTFGAALLFSQILHSKEVLPYCFLSSNFLAMLISLGAFIHYFKPKWKYWSLRPLPSRALLKYCLPAAGSDSLLSIASRLDIFFLAGLTGVKTLEIYNVISMIAKTLASLRQSFEPVLLAALSQNKSLELMQVRFQRAASFVFSLKIPVLFFFCIWAKDILYLIDPQYALGYWPLVCILTLVTLCTFTDFSSVIVYALAKTWAAPLVTIAYFVLGMTLNTILVPKFQLMGAALAQGLALSLAGFIWYGVSQKSFGQIQLIHWRGFLRLLIPVLFYLPVLAIEWLGIGSHVWKWLLYPLAFGLNLWWWKGYFGRWNLELTSKVNP